MVWVAVLLPFSASSQTDPLEKEKVVRPKADREKAYQAKATRSSAAEKAALKKAEDEKAAVQGKATFTVGMTSALSRTPQELFGLLPEKEKTAAEIEQQEKENAETLKAAGNEKVRQLLQTENGMVRALPPVALMPATPVKDQGGCGSCWAFAAAAGWEHSYKKLYGGTKNMSEQSLLACGTNCNGADAGSCNGGYTADALAYIKCTGTATNLAYPYNINNANNCVNKPKPFKAISWGYLPSNATRDQIKEAILQYGSLVASVKANVGGFGGYTGGVLNGYPSNSQGINHAIVVIGWHEPLGAWIIKNSWGTDWGIDGFAYLKYDHYNLSYFKYIVAKQ